MDLLALADFNLVARHGGFGKAAPRCGALKATRPDTWRSGRRASAPVCLDVVRGHSS